MKSKNSFLFIIQGEGRGHLTQAIRLKNILEQNGHNIISVCYGYSPQRKIPEHIYEVFSKKVVLFRSPNFIRTRNRKGIHLLRSLLYNVLRSFSYIHSVNVLRNLINSEKPDLVINFYDMLGGLAFYFSKRDAVYYCISHHFIFESPRFKAPEGFLMQKILFRYHNHLVALKSEKRLALSFDYQPSFGKTIVLPPLIRSELLVGDHKFQDHVLVYLLNEGLSIDLLPVFDKYRKIKFIVFMQSGIDPGVFPENVRLHEPGKDDFTRQLLICSAVISTAGFETVCEAAFLGKPVFLVPSENHYEQYGNFEDARRTGIALSYLSFNPDYISPRESNDFSEWCMKAEKLFLETLLP